MMFVRMTEYSVGGRESSSFNGRVKLQAQAKGVIRSYSERRQGGSVNPEPRPNDDRREGVKEEHGTSQAMVHSSASGASIAS
jgi:hypothetical protein